MEVLTLREFVISPLNPKIFIFRVLRTMEFLRFLGLMGVFVRQGIPEKPWNVMVFFQ